MKIHYKIVMGCLLLASFVLVGTTAYADVTVIDDLGGFGASALVRDSSTGLDWLNLNFTAHLSYNDVIAQMGVGGTFSGYRYATRSELARFWRNAGISGRFDGEGNAANLAPIQELLAMIGATSCLGQCSIARTAEDANNWSTPSRLYSSLQWANGLGFADDLSLGAISDAEVRVGLASWLTKQGADPEPVPEPASVTLLGMGVATIGLLLKRRNG